MHPQIFKYFIAFSPKNTFRRKIKARRVLKPALHEKKEHHKISIRRKRDAEPKKVAVAGRLEVVALRNPTVLRVIVPTAAALELIAETGYEPQYGARPIKRTIQRLVETPASRLLISGELFAGKTLFIDGKGFEVALSVE